MNKDFALRKDHDGQVGMLNVLHATYNPPKAHVTTKSYSLPEMEHLAKPMTVKVPEKQILNRLYTHEKHTNPDFRKKYKLPKKEASMWFDHEAYTSYP